MGTYVILRAEAYINRHSLAEWTLSKVFNAFSANDMDTATEHLRKLVKRSKHDDFTAAPVLESLRYIAKTKGPEAAAETAKTLAKAARWSRRGLDEQIKDLARDGFRAVTEAVPETPVSPIAIQQMTIPRFINGLRGIPAPIWHGHDFY